MPELPSALEGTRGNGPCSTWLSWCQCLAVLVSRATAAHLAAHGAVCRPAPSCSAPLTALWMLPAKVQPVGLQSRSKRALQEGQAPESCAVLWILFSAPPAAGACGWEFPAANPPAGRAAARQAMRARRG